VQELSLRYTDIVMSRRGGKAKIDPRLLFQEMVEIALWGNATDLSLLSNLSLDEIQKLQGAAAIKQNQRNIVDNDTDAVWEYLTSSARLTRIDIVLDNSGFEFFTDLIFALYLLEERLTVNIVLHVKDFPWFVSDVTPHDVDITMDHLAAEEYFPNRTAVDPVLIALRCAFNSGRLSFQQHPFWTTAASFHELPKLAPDLRATLQESGLVIFKGDLNYRKLTRDGMWPYTTPFSTALGPMGESSGVKILALRTNKADVCVGLTDEAQVKVLDAEAPNAAWVRSGKYAVVSFSRGS
jgi:hypothetical protein